MAFIVNCYDLLIKNGTVVDPANGNHKKMDIGIYASKIVDVFEPGTLPGKICGRKVIDAQGKFVVPGLVDGHVHVLPGLRFEYPIDELWKRGITACLDMGSQTSASFHRARKIIDEAPCVINACLGISNMAETQGEIPRYTILDQEVDKEKIKMLFEAHGDVLIGIKVFIGHNDSPGAELTHAVLKKSREVCDYVGCRMFVHVANPDIPFAELIQYFKPGDNFTHSYNKGNILDENGRVYPEAWEAKKRGVLFDSARGSRNWSAEVAKAAFEQGFYPDVITDDLTCLGNDPGTSRLTVHMSECMALGMSLEDVLYAATNVPASYMRGVSVGIKRGLDANITILDISEDGHRFTDAFGVPYEGKSFIEPRATIIKGKIMYNEIKTDY
jgi:dihydroorotase